ncbi:MAG: recombinase family protein [Planctomycetaceae bacterium]
MSRKKALLPAVGYLRKSTKGERADGTQKQEKSLAQQRAEIVKLVEGQYEIVKWFTDEGVSGWKRGAKRPDFQRMIAEVHQLGAQAIVCDNIDRFSRASVDDVQEDARALRQAGVRWIVTASHGDYDLGNPNNIGEILKFVVAVWSSHEYSRQLSRRVSLARRNAAANGKRTGGTAPFGLQHDGKGGLKHGDPKKVELVRWIFDQFANQSRSITWIIGDLNRRKVPSPSGPKSPWTSRTVASMLRREVYRGDFVYNKRPSGQFFRIDSSGDVVEKAEVNGTGKVIALRGAYTPIIAPALWEKVQNRLATVSQKRNRRKAAYALSGGILVCDHCGSRLVGCKPNKKVVYRCPSYSVHGIGSCNQWQVREEDILPFILETLSKEIDDLTNLQRQFVKPVTDADRRAEKQSERDALSAKIEHWVEGILDITDRETRQALDRRISEAREQLAALDAALAAPDAVDDSERMRTFLQEVGRYFKGLVKVPKATTPNDPDVVPFVLADPRKVNEALHELGAEIRLRWRTDLCTLRNGGTRRRHILVRGRFRLGQRRGKLPQYLLEPPVGPNRKRATADEPPRRPGRQRRSSARSGDATRLRRIRTACRATTAVDNLVGIMLDQRPPFGPTNGPRQIFSPRRL